MSMSRHLYVFVAGMLASVGSAHAALLESFAYPVGSQVSGANGGAGFAAAWGVASPGGVKIGNGLAYRNGADLVTASGAAIADSSVANGVLTRRYEPGLPGSGEVWISFLANVTVSSSSYALLALSSGGNPNQSTYAFSLARVSPTSQTLQAAIAPYPGGGAGAAVAATQISSGATALIVTRIVMNGTTAPDPASLWVNPRLDLPLGSPDASLSTINLNASSVGFLRVELGSRTTSIMDEIRVGSSAAEVLPVVPLPGSGILLATAGSAFAVGRRRIRR
jgi:hypothetical protein